MRLIDADLMAEDEGKAFNKTRRNIDEPFTCKVLDMAHDFIRRLIFSTPTVDAVPVVRCEHCVRHDSCWVEDAFMAARIDNPFCAAGKRRA